MSIYFTDYPGGRWPDPLPGHLYLQNFTGTSERDYALYVSAPDGSEELQLASFTRAFTWSSDGTQIAYGLPLSDTDDIAVYVVNGDGTELKRVAELPQTWGLSIAWSPDGASLALGVRAHGGDQIMVMNADGSNPRILVTGTSGTSLSWSSDSSRILFVNRGGVFVIDVETGNMSTLVPEGSYVNWAIWAPDGSMIAVPVNGVSVMQPDGSGLRSITEEYSEYGLPNGRIVWSRDSLFLAFCISQAWPLEHELLVAHADGTELRRLSFGRGCADPSWSPDGRFIAYTAYGGVHFVNVGHPEWTYPMIPDAGSAVWSPVPG